MLIVEGLKLMAIGMGMVFIFLILMVFLINASARILAPFSGMLEEAETASSPSKRKRTSTDSGKEDSAMIAAIISAVHQFRRDNSEK